MTPNPDSISVSTRNNGAKALRPYTVFDSGDYHDNNVEHAPWTSCLHSQHQLLWRLWRNAGIKQSTDAARLHGLAQSCKKWLRVTRPCPTKWSNQASDSYQATTACTRRSGQLPLVKIHDLFLKQGAIMTATWKTVSGPAAFKAPK